MKNSVRLATNDDCDRLVALNRQVQGLHAEQFPEFFLPVVDDLAVAEFFVGVLASERSEIALSPATGEPTGYIWIEHQSRDGTPFTKPWRRLYVHHLAVAESARRQGVATALMQWAEGRARTLGIEMLVLEHLAGVADAEAFYERSGFAPSRVVRLRRLT